MNQDMLKTILNTLSLGSSTDHINIMGHDPVLSTPFLIGEAGAATLGAVGYAASGLWELKTGRLQQIQISVREGAIAQRSHGYLKKLEGDTPDLWSPFSGFYETQDHRWVQFHCNFPHHQQGILDFFACPPDKEKLIQAVKLKQGIEIEDALNHRGLCAALLRTSEEWAVHPQAKAISTLPLLEITKIGHSKPEPLPEGGSVLSGIRVLDLSRVLAGPVCGKTLAQLGADVLRISHPNLPFILPLVMDTGFGKRNAYLDIKNSAHKQNLLDLIQTGDVFMQAYRPGAFAEQGFSKDNLAKLRPGIIYVDLSAYSHAGPWADRHGYDSLVQTATGIAYEQTAGQTKPQHLPAQSLDYLTGYLAAFAIMEALRRRALEGGSYWIKLSLAQTGHWFTHLGRATGFESCHNPKSEEISDLLETVHTPFGTLEHLKPVLKLSDTPLRDFTPPQPLGSDQAVWKK